MAKVKVGIAAAERKLEYLYTIVHPGNDDNLCKERLRATLGHRAPNRE